MAISFIDPTQLPFVATFLLVFAIVFGLLSLPKKSKNKRGEEVEISVFDKKVNAIIAVVFAFFSVIYEPLVLTLQAYMPFIATGLILIFVVMFIKKIFGGGENKDYFPLIVSIAILLLVLIAAGSDILDLLPGNVDRTQALWVIGFILIVVIFYAAYHHGGEAPAQTTPRVP